MKITDIQWNSCVFPFSWILCVCVCVSCFFVCLFVCLEILGFSFLTCFEHSKLLKLRIHTFRWYFVFYTFFLLVLFVVDRGNYTILKKKRVPWIEVAWKKNISKMHGYQTEHHQNVTKMAFFRSLTLSNPFIEMCKCLIFKHTEYILIYFFVSFTYIFELKK